MPWIAPAVAIAVAGLAALVGITVVQAIRASRGEGRLQLYARELHNVCVSRFDVGKLRSKGKTVQEEDRQNNELLDLSKQILALTKQVSSYGDTVKEESEQNKELLDLSRRTLALTTEVHSVAGAGTGNSASATPSLASDDPAPGS